MSDHVRCSRCARVVERMWAELRDGEWLCAGCADAEDE